MEALPLRTKDCVEEAMEASWTVVVEMEACLEGQEEEEETLLTEVEEEWEDLERLAMEWVWDHLPPSLE